MSVCASLCVCECVLTYVCLSVCLSLSLSLYVLTYVCLSASLCVCECVLTYVCVQQASFSALHLAAQNGHNQCTRVLLFAGCSTQHKNNVITRTSVCRCVLLDRCVYVIIYHTLTCWLDGIHSSCEKSQASSLQTFISTGWLESDMPLFGYSHL